jgi:hypothetical protein
VVDLPLRGANVFMVYIVDLLYNKFRKRTKRVRVRVRVIGNTGIGNTGKGIGDKGLVI